MKKWILGSLLFVISLGLFGCSFGRNNDSRYCDENIKNLVNILASDDTLELKDQFATNMKKNIPNFENSLTELCKYCDGEFVSNSESVPTVAVGHNGDKKENIIYIQQMLLQLQILIDLM